MKIFPIIFLTLLLLINTKLDEITIFKALVCVNIITSKHQEKDLEPSSLSPIILTCYIKISDEQVHRLTEGIEQGLDIPLSDEEIEELTNIDSLKDLPESEVRRKGDELEKAIKEFQKIQEGYSETGEDDGYDDGDDDYDYDDYGDGPKNNMTKRGFFRLIKKGIISLTEIFFSSWYIIGILVLFYVLLLEIRRNNNPPNDTEEKEEKENQQNDKDNKEEDNNKQENEEQENKKKEIKEVNKEKEVKKEEDNKISEDNKKTEDKKEVGDKKQKQD